MPTSRSPVARSRYRQLRLTATHEIGGRFSVSLYGKPLNAQWNEHSCLMRYSVEGTTVPLDSTEDVIQALLLVLEETMLPRALKPGDK